jgi:DNA repair exonuclease SbcCD ATPase subunit
MSKIEEKRKLSQSKSATELKIATLTSDLANQRADYKEKLATIKENNKNKDAISKNAEIDALINMENATIRTQTTLKTSSETQNSNLEKEISKINESISTKKSYIIKIEEERKVEKCWKIYLQMIGKDGISKMVLRNTLPIINGELGRLLNDVADFDVEITMNDKNDIDFLLNRDGVTTRLSAASGLEKTQSALALRVVLGSMSRLSRPPFILLDEVLGTVAKENYDDMKKLYDKIAEYYDFILHITHISDIVDWHDGGIVTVIKENNISRIKCAQ